MSVLMNWKKIFVGLSLIFIAIYPVIHGDTYIMHIFILFFIWSVVASNWNLLMDMPVFSLWETSGF